MKGLPVHLRDSLQLSTVAVQELPIVHLYVLKTVKCYHVAVNSGLSN